MNEAFSGIGISALDFTGISAIFILTMLLFFGIKNKKYSWLHTLSLLILVLQCALIILFRDGLTTKLFAALMLMTTFIVEVVISRRKRFGVSESGL